MTEHWHGYRVEELVEELQRNGALGS